MALTLSDLVEELNEITLTERRPQRKFNSLIREIANEPITGKLTIDSVTQTVAYTRVKSLRDGKTIKCALPQTDYTLELQVHAAEDVQKGTNAVFTFALDKFDGYSLVFYAHQVELIAADSATKKDIVQSKTPPQDPNSTTGTPVVSKHSSPNLPPKVEDPLAVFRAEALAILSKDAAKEITDTSQDQALLKQLQDESRQHLVELTRRAESHAKEDLRELDSESPQAVTNTSSSGSDQGVNAPTKSPISSQAVSNQTIPADDDILDSTNHTEHVDNLKSEVKASTNPTSTPTPETPNPPSKEKTAPPAPPNLDELLGEALGESDVPVNLELLSTIVSLQTGIPVATVAEAQKHMWMAISSPTTFGEGKSRYRFPLLGEFLVRKNGGDISLDFSSNEIETIASAKVNESVDYKQAAKYVETNSGPLIARHALALGLGTASAMGIQKAHSYMVVYRTVLLLLRIIGKGTRRIRIEDVGEFFPSMISGAKAYRFRVYPALLRATSSAFKDATVFLSNPGEAQKRFDEQPLTPNKSSELSPAGVGCVLLVGLFFAIAFWLAAT